MTVEERINILMLIESQRGYLYGQEQNEWFHLRDQEDMGRGDWILDPDTGTISPPEE